MKDLREKPTIFMMDLLATVPYYTAYLAKALLADGVPLKVGSISYYLDADCFSSRAVPLSPGLMDVVGRFPLPNAPRRILKLAEALLNLSALSLRFLIKPPAIVHVQYLPLLLWPLPLDLWFLRWCRLRGSRILFTVHDLVPHNTTDQYREIFRRLYGWVDAVICHSEHVKARLEEEFSVRPEKIFVIPHGPFFHDLPENRQILRDSVAVENGTRFLWQGILSPYKGVDILLDAWQKVERLEPAASLAVVGTGTRHLLDELREQADRLGLKNVRFDLRFVATRELVDLYLEADVVIYPYRAITTSGALATGLALDKTIVASDLPAFRELLVHEKNALLVPVGDANALADALVQLARDRCLREALAAEVAAMNFAEQTWQSIADKTTHVYQELVGEEFAQLASSSQRAN